MRILVFIEGTLLIEPTWVGLSPSEIVAIVKAGKKPRDFSKFVPVGNAVRKLEVWTQQGGELIYLTSRILPNEIDDIRNVLKKYEFPEGIFLYRRDGEAYKDIAERVIPDILIEDDYASDGGVADMTYPHLNSETKKRIKSIVIPEFSGIDQLPDGLSELANYSK
ncbi:MAG: hypothetical protein M1282_02150 [Chloroflexi bacterium]|nr:hypothetical protein [Chloroflexota bacterium]